jgi:hypothetical protein
MFELFKQTEGNSVFDEQVIKEPFIMAQPKLNLGACSSQALPLDGDLCFISMLISSTISIWFRWFVKHDKVKAVHL